MFLYYNNILIFTNYRMTLLEQQVKSSIKENKINKRLANYSLAITKSKPKKAPKVQVPPDDANSLLNRIIASNLNEAAITKRLNDISYGAINGERQEVKSYQPEGTVMLGQLGREKPLDAITKEMIEGYQQDLNKPYFVDGEARQYSESGYTPVLQVPVDYQDIADENKTLMAERNSVAMNIKDADDLISNLNKYIKSLKTDINFFGITLKKDAELKNLTEQLTAVVKQREALGLRMEKIKNKLTTNSKTMLDIHKANSLIPARNQEEVAKYETALLQHNRNRLNIQKQPYESDMDYYKRLREIELQKADPSMYKKYATNNAVKELKPKMTALFQDNSKIESIIKLMDDETKFLVNKNFDTIQTKFITDNGFNPTMSDREAVNQITSYLKSNVSQLAAIFKRKKDRDTYTNPILAAEDLNEAIKAARERSDKSFIENERLSKILKARENQQQTLDELMRNSTPAMNVVPPPIIAERTVIPDNSMEADIITIALAFPGVYTVSDITPDDRSYATNIYSILKKTTPERQATFSKYSKEKQQDFYRRMREGILAKQAMVSPSAIEISSPSPRPSPMAGDSPVAGERNYNFDIMGLAAQEGEKYNKKLQEQRRKKAEQVVLTFEHIVDKSHTPREDDLRVAYIILDKIAEDPSYVKFDKFTYARKAKIYNTFRKQILKEEADFEELEKNKRLALAIQAMQSGADTESPNPLGSKTGKKKKK